MAILVSTCSRTEVKHGGFCCCPQRKFGIRSHELKDRLLEGVHFYNGGLIRKNFAIKTHQTRSEGIRWVSCVHNVDPPAMHSKHGDRKSREENRAPSKETRINVFWPKDTTQGSIAHTNAFTMWLSSRNLMPRYIYLQHSEKNKALRKEQRTELLSQIFITDMLFLFGGLRLTENISVHLT